MKFTIKELRTRLNKTQSEVAMDIGICNQTYNSWERDISNVSVSKVHALATYFGVTLDDIEFTRNH